VADDVETGVAKWQLRAVGGGDPAVARQIILHRPFRRDPQARERNVDQRDIAATGLGHIKPRPARPRADIQQPDAGTQFQQRGEFVRLIPVGPARRAIIAAEHATFDRLQDRRLVSQVDLVESIPLGLVHFSHFIRARWRLLSV